MQRRSRLANEGPYLELGLDIWNNLGRPDEAAEHENGEVITNGEEHKSNNTVRKTISFWHKNTGALFCNVELDKRTETKVTIMTKLYKKSDEYNQFDFQSSRPEYSLCRSRLLWH